MFCVERGLRRCVAPRTPPLQNPRIRALALRVMSSIRVHATVPIVMLAIKKCSTDSSVYVRKAAAHAIPKVRG